MRRLCIDDLRLLQMDDVTYARTPEYGLRLLQNDGPWDEVYLDHDMGAKDIKPVVYWMESVLETEDEPDVGEVFVITGNPYAADWMCRGLAGYGATRLPYIKCSYIDLIDSLDEAHNEWAALQLLDQESA